ncbi:hypothetical protein G7046_g1434 [Stylonectria norvegica]|nr:hypothetical protein G7046_g1434 [Stylonectria norvegica]
MEPISEPMASSPGFALCCTLAIMELKVSHAATRCTVSLTPSAALSLGDLGPEPSAVAVFEELDASGNGHGTDGLGVGIRVAATAIKQQEYEQRAASMPQSKKETNMSFQVFSIFDESSLGLNLQYAIGQIPEIPVAFSLPPDQGSSWQTPTPHRTGAQPTHSTISRPRLRQRRDLECCMLRYSAGRLAANKQLEHDQLKQQPDSLRLSAVSNGPISSVPSDLSRPRREVCPSVTIDVLIITGSAVSRQ